MEKREQLLWSGILIRFMVGVKFLILIFCFLFLTKLDVRKNFGIIRMGLYVFGHLDIISSIFRISKEDRDILNSKQPERIFIFNGEAGSKCDNGYKNNDGLCKATVPTVTTNTKEKTTGNSENDGSNEKSSSCPIFSMVHILVVLGFGYSIFT
ncbi:hypothetical protein B9Z55_007958 [Caenorhabditis nigoni]|uniref:Uncharacterized protein n=1 Tax=Caenorhabditis nigoni TaxID=1611254 RepID=A0A2G5VC15_9PELO|nr:hypothetical protein B9Z55_007958 [Caenorhabditis nigoni]